MKRFAIVLILLSTAATPSFCKTHKEMYTVSCPTLWPAVKDVLRNSGKYGILSIDNTEMSASYNIGGTWAGKRVNSLVLNTKPEGCEMQIQTAYSGLGNNDEGDFKKRVDEALAKLRTAPPSAPATLPAAPPDGATPPAKKPDGTPPS
jgi:hypothetical protein